MLAAVVCAEDTAFLPRPGQSAEGAREDVVRTVRIDDDSADAAGFLESHMLPGLSSVYGFVHAITRDIAVSNGPCFSRTSPDTFGSDWATARAPDGGDGLVIKDSREAVPAINAFPDSTGCRPSVVRIRIAGHACYRSDAIADKRT